MNRCTDRTAMRIVAAKMEALPQEVEQFINQQIDSVGQLEGLLLLYRSGTQRWQATEVARRLYISEDEAQRAILLPLVERGLLQSVDGGFAFRADDATLVARVRDLEKYYATHLIPISNLIHSKASRRIQEFADAFSFKRRK